MGSLDPYGGLCQFGYSSVFLNSGSSESPRELLRTAVVLVLPPKILLLIDLS